MAKKTSFLLLVCFLLSRSLCAQVTKAKLGERPIATGTDTSKIIAAFSRFSAFHPQEKIHIHFDKQRYRLGDTVWFKVYLVNAIGNRLSSLSKVIHVDLEVSKGKQIQLLLPVNSGMASGSITLTDAVFNVGRYKLKAYTQSMLNDAKDNCFSSELSIVDELDRGPNVSKINNGLTPNNRIQVDKNIDSLDLQFFPEGGILVSGVRSKVAFKALSRSGESISIKGHIENSQGEHVAVFESIHAGMGFFALVPAKNQHYLAVIDSGNYKGMRIVMPQITEEGISLSVNRLEKDFLVRITKSPGVKSIDSVQLVVHANGALLQLYKLALTEQSITLHLPFEDLEEGINQFTLFSQNNIPLAERLVFVNKQTQLTEVTTDQKEYHTREKVKLSIAVLDDKNKGIIGGYSVSVTKPDDQLPEDRAASIYANLLLTSDLKGYIENPNYYFNAVTPSKLTALDALMMTQGWRRFVWKDVLDDKGRQNETPTPEGLAVRGQITTLSEVPIPGAKVTLMITKDLIVIDTLADQSGRFCFDNLFFTDSAEVILKASTVRGPKNVKIVLDQRSEKSIPTALVEENSGLVDRIESKENEGPISQNLQPVGKIKQGTTLQTVSIVRKRRPEIKGSIYPFAAPPPDYTLEPDVLQETSSLIDYLRGRFPGVIIKDDKVYGINKGILGVMTIMLNGMAIDDLSAVSPRALTGVQIVKGGVTAENMATELMLQSEGTSFGVILLTMKGIDPKYIKANRPTGFLQFPMLGYQAVRTFYSPNYEQMNDPKKHDYRATLFWKPDLITDKDGKAQIDFYTSDELGSY